jgi:hypothetical protein
MKRYGMGRVLAVLFLGLVRGAYIHFDEMRWLKRGRDAFLGYQGHRFDSFAANPSAATMLMVGIIMAAVVFGAYELVAAGITRLLPLDTTEA